MTARLDYRHHYTAAFTALLRNGHTCQEAHTQACDAATLAVTCEEQLFGENEKAYEALRAERDQALEDYRQNEKSLQEYERMHGDGIDALETLVWSSFPALKAVRPSEFADDPEHYEALLAAIGEIAQMSHEADEAAREVGAMVEDQAEKLEAATNALEAAAKQQAEYEKGYAAIAGRLWPGADHMHAIERSGLAGALLSLAQGVGEELAEQRLAYAHLDMKCARLLDAMRVGTDKDAHIVRLEECITQLSSPARNASLKRYEERAAAAEAELERVRAELEEATSTAKQLDAELAQLRREMELELEHADARRQGSMGDFLADPTTLSAVP
jgi:hypothetical protein